MVTVPNPSGLHARPASEFVALARTFQSRVAVRNVSAGGRAADAKNPLRLLGAKIYQHDQIEISAEGPDEDEAVEALVAFVRSLG